MAEESKALVPIEIGQPAATTHLLPSSNLYKEYIKAVKKLTTTGGKFILVGLLLVGTLFSYSSAPSSLAALPSGSNETFLPLVKVSPGPREMWVSSATLASLQTSGPAWQNLLEAAQEDTSSPDISDLDDMTDVYVLAKALVYARTGQVQYRNQVMAAITAVMGTESNAEVLPVARGLQSYVIAADLIPLSAANPALDHTFRQWLSNIRYVVFDGTTPYSITSCHKIRPNNVGTHCGAARIAIALYLGDSAELQQAATVFQGWLGDRSVYAGFNYGDLDWQCNPSQPVGINPAGCTRDGHSIDGVLPDDQRRSGGFTWPPPQENYVWEALQGAIVQANLLARAGYPAWQWQDQALRRAITWLHQQANYPAAGDDSWQPWLFNDAYKTIFPAPLPSSPGKGMGWTDWTHGQYSSPSSCAACPGPVGPYHSSLHWLLVSITLRGNST